MEAQRIGWTSEAEEEVDETVLYSRRLFPLEISKFSHMECPIKRGQDTTPLIAPRTSFLLNKLLVPDAHEFMHTVRADTAMV